jgi:hypothetical protein
MLDIPAGARQRRQHSTEEYNKFGGPQQCRDPRNWPLNSRKRSSNCMDETLFRYHRFRMNGV